ncbi:MAG: hypothetical protein IJC57_01035 [Clostridia bacterium]|nr:hypothetical protein [Clostridia bacterium]
MITNKLFKQVSSMILLILFGLSNVFLQPQVKAVDLTEYEVIALVDKPKSNSQFMISSVFLNFDAEQYYCKKQNIKLNHNTIYPRIGKGKHKAEKPTLYIICDPNFEAPDTGKHSCLYLLTPETRNSKNVKKLPKDRVFTTVYDPNEDLAGFGGNTELNYPEKLQKILETALTFEYNKERGWTLRDQEEKYLNLPPLPWHSTPSGKLGLRLTGTCLLSLGAALVYNTYNYVKTNNNKKSQN